MVKPQVATHADPSIDALLVMNNGKIEELANHIAETCDVRQCARLIERLTSIVSSIAERMT